MLADYLISNVMNHKLVHLIGEFDPVSQAIQLMDDHGISALPVQNNVGQFCGVISKSDIASKKFLRCLQEQPDPAKVAVKAVMNRTVPLIIRDNQSVLEAVQLMYSRHIHRLFVLDDQKRLCGTLSSTDIMRFLVVEKHL